MARSSSGNSSGSCKLSGNSRSRSTSRCSNSGSRNSNSCSSTNGSCGHTGYVKKINKGHSGLQCRHFLSCKNAGKRKRCKGIHAWNRIDCCGMSEESHCHSKKWQTHECCAGVTREEDDQECSARMQKCQHNLASFSTCVFGRILSCNWCCHNRLVCNQEPDEMTKLHDTRRRKVCSFCKRHGRCCNCHCHDFRAPFCENHATPNGNDCCFKKISRQADVTNVLDKKLAELEGHGPLEGNVKSEGLSATNDVAPTQDIFKAHGNDSLTSNLAKTLKPIVADFDSDDIGLDLPGSAYSVLSKNMLGIDQNIIAADDKKSLPDMCAAAGPLSCDFGFQMLRRSSGSSQDLTNYKVSCCKKGGTSSCQKAIDIVVLDDTDDESMQNANTKLDVHCVNEPADLKKEEDSSTSVKKSVMESIADYAPHVRDGEGSTTWKGNNVEGTCIQADNEAAVGAVDRSERCLPQSKMQPSSSIQNSSLLGPSARIFKKIHEATVPPENEALGHRGFKPRKKRMVDKSSLPLLYPEEKDDKGNPYEAALVATVTVQKAVLSKMVEAKPRMWEGNILCDLCRKGPSLYLGEWYAWCCGVRLHSCGCSTAAKMKMKLAVSTKRSNKPKKMDGMALSGMVHKMCALWSSEVYEDEERLQGLFDAVKRGNLLICASCKEYGATLGCRVKTCRRSFHYPCADELASKLCCRMWDGVQHPVACRGHRYVSETCTNAKERPLNLKKWRFRGFVLRKRVDASGISLQQNQSSSFQNLTFKESEVTAAATTCLQPKCSPVLAKRKSVDVSNTVIDISSDDEAEKKMEAAIQESGLGLSNPANAGPSDPFKIALKQDLSSNQEIGEHRVEDSSHALYHMGTKLLCEDISGGHEAVLIPCTNDVDSEPAPVVNYIIENRYLGKAKLILESLLQAKTRIAARCKGCDVNNVDNPTLEASVHAALRNFQRESDTRFDWQGQSMLGRLPYDLFGRLQLGPDTKDVVECNSQCPCGVGCLNRELQRGLRTPLEVFKTRDRGWGVRTMDQICRGKFVVEYIGEVITHDEAHVRGIKYDMSNFSCLFSADHPDVPAEDLLVIDGFRMSNVARFINHSCDGNLRVYRVYTETTDLRFCRIGLYALRDIEIGEELSYDYGYITCKDANTTDFSNDPTAIKCLCGASNCGQWLWTGTAR